MAHTYPSKVNAVLTHANDLGVCLLRRAMPQERFLDHFFARLPCPARHAKHEVASLPIPLPLEAVVNAAGNATPPPKHVTTAANT